MRATSQALQDMSNNSLIAILSNAGHLSTNLVPDSVSPALDSFDLDMNTGTLLLVFSEIVNAASFDIGQVVLQGQGNISSADEDLYHRLSGGQLPLGTVSSQTNAVTITVRMLYNVSISI